MTSFWSGVIGKFGSLLVAACCFWLFLRFFEWRNLYYPARHLSATPSDYGLEYEDVEFVAEDGVRLHGWWIPCPDARGTLLYCHGNAGNIGDRAALAADLHRLGIHVFLFDYRGYGRSRGVPTEKGTYRDARAAYEVVRARYQDAEAPPVVVYGRSLGGAVAVHLALEKPVRGLVLESTFTSTVDMANHIYPWLPAGLICRYRYDSLSKIGTLRIPKLFAHSRQDEVVPFELGRRLFDAAPEPKSFHEIEGGHNDSGWMTSPRYGVALGEFINRLFGA